MEKYTIPVSLILHSEDIDISVSKTFYIGPFDTKIGALRWVEIFRNVVATKTAIKEHFQIGEPEAMIVTPYDRDVHDLIKEMYSKVDKELAEAEKR